MSNKPTSLVWFRQDLRLADHPALAATIAHGGRVIPLYILDDETPGRWAPGGASRWWLHGSLEALGADLARLGAPLVLRRGAAEPVLLDVVAATGADAVFWNRCYEPFAVRRDEAIKRVLKERGLHVESFNGALLFEPWTVRRRDGAPFRTYSSFARACDRLPEPDVPLAAPVEIKGPARVLDSDCLEDWKLRPTAPDWAAGLRATWQPGEAAAHRRLESFFERGIEHYGTARHQPELEATSRLSPHLHFGEVSARQVWHAAQAARARRDDGRGFGAFVREILWREFAYHLLFHAPGLPEEPLDPRFAALPWRDDPAALRAWQRGRTGYPIVDAGMRQMRATGWMHNRARMITGSFLVKDLLLPWQEGAAWFWDNLVDADLPNNSLGWQWVASTGPDAAPFVRIANPVLQAERFDPEGAYVRCWVPELAGLPSSFIHKPWAAPDDLLRAAGVRLGETYPMPLVDHGAARVRALAAYEAVRGAATGTRGACTGRA